jgi:hypothetical protein
MPVAMRCDARALTEASDVMLARAPDTFSKRWAAGAAIVSTSVFHTPQCGHCPCHFGAEPPHSVQL